MSKQKHKSKSHLLVSSIRDELGIELSPEQTIALSGHIENWVKKISGDGKQSMLSMMMGSSEPYSSEAEEAALGWVLNGNDDLVVQAIVTNGDELFFSENNKIIAHAIIESYSRDRSVNYHKVVEILRSLHDRNDVNHLERIGGSAMLDSMRIDAPGSSPEAESLIGVLRGYRAKRMIMDFGISVFKDASISDPDTIDQVKMDAEVKLADITLQSDESDYLDSFQVADQVYKRMLYLNEQGDGGEFIEFPSCLSGVNEWGGYLPGEIWIYVGRPGSGKTAHLMSEVESDLDAGRPVIICSQEMSAVQLCMRLMSMRGVINMESYRRGKVSQEDLEKVATFLDWLKSKNVFIIDRGKIEFNKFISIVGQLINKIGKCKVYVDYLQLHKLKGKSSSERSLELYDIANSYKDYSKRFEVPFIIYSQANRENERRGGDKRIQLSDISGSGGIEMAADCVLAFYRPEYYNIYEDEDGSSLRGVGFIDPLKGREGAFQQLRCDFKGYRWTDPGKGEDWNNSKNNKAAQPSARDYLLAGNKVSKSNNNNEDIPF